MQLDDFLNKGFSSNTSVNVPDETILAGSTTKNKNKKETTPKTPAPLATQIGEESYGNRIGSMLAEHHYDLTHLDPIGNKYEEYGVRINSFNSEEELNKERATNQGWLEQAGRATVQAIGNEMVIGTAKAFSDIFDAVANIATPKGEDDYTNPVSQFFENLQNDIRDRFEIYQKDPNQSWAIGDFGWWANNSVSTATTVSMLVPSLTITKGLSLLSKGLKFGKLSRGIAKAYKYTTKSERSVERLTESINLTSKLASTAIISRTAENYQEARQVYNEVKEDFSSRIKDMSPEEKQQMIERNPQLVDKSDEEIVNYIAGTSADKTFINDYAMLLMDMAQFKAIGSLWKGMTKKSINGKLITENKNAINKLAGKTVKDIAKEATTIAEKLAAKSPWLANRINSVKHAINHPLASIGAIAWLEGIEEAYQGIQTEKGKEVAEMILDPEYTPRTISSYLADPTIWEQAFWGVIGGITFQAAGSTLGNLYRKGKAKYQHKQGKLSDEDLALGLTAEERVRTQEIQDRVSLHNHYKTQMERLNNLEHPEELAKDAITGEIIEEDGVEQHKKLTQEEAEVLKAKVTNDYVSALVMRAVEAGNYELLKDYISSPEFNKAMKETGVEVNENFDQQLLNKMENVANNYATALHNVLKNTEITNESIARITAREITRERLAIDELNEKKDIISSQLNEVNTSDVAVIDNYKRKAVTKYVRQKLNELDKRQDDMYNAYRNNAISEQAKTLYERDYNIRRQSLIKFLNNNNVFEGTIAEQIKELVKVNPKNADTITSEFNKTMNVIESLLSEEANDEITKATKELVDKEIALDDAIAHQETLLPRNQQDYIDRVEDTTMEFDTMAKKRLGKAAKNVEEYIISQKNLDQALEDVVTNNVPKLKEDVDLLKMGYYRTNDFYKIILATVAEEKAKRTKQENAKNESTIDGKQGNAKQTNTIRQGIEDINNAGETNTNKEQQEDNIHFTGEPASRSDASQTQTNQTSQDKSINTNATNFDQIKGPIEGQPFVTREDIENLDKAAKADATKVAEAFQITIDDRAIGLASSVAFEIFRTDRHLFDNALGKDINSAEVRTIIDEVSNRLTDQGVSIGLAPAAAQRGVKMSINTIVRRLKAKKDSKADMFKQLADTIATKQEFEGERAANTKTVSGIELNQIIDKLLELYADIKSVATPKGQKIVINLDKLFNEIIYNQDIDIDTAMMILYNMKDYISNPINTKYVFTSRRSLNALLKNPAEFFESVSNARMEEKQLDNYMHIAPVSHKTEEYENTIAGLRGGEDVEVSYTSDKGSQNSISLKVNGVEIGFLSTVTPNITNTGFRIFVSQYSGGIAYEINKNGTEYSSNTDELFDAVFDEDDELWSIVNKYRRHRINSANRHISADEAKKLFNHPVIQKAIADGVIILPKKYNPNTKKVEDKYTIDEDKGKFIVAKLEGVAFYNPYAESSIEYIDSYQQWLANAYSNYENTHKIQQALTKSDKVITKVAGLANTYKQGASSDVQVIIDDQEHGINEIGLTFDRNPIVAVMNTDNGAILVNEGTGKTIVSHAPFKVGSMGMLIGGRENTPILAMFTSANKVAGEMKENLKVELTDIITGFQESRYGFEDVDRKLSALFNGPGINNPTVFQGYSVVHNSNSIGLAIGGELSKYVLVINKFKKGTTEKGTGITYASNGNLDTAKSSISVDKQFINKLVNEIVNNVVYNRTFFTLNNIGKGDVTTNPYMKKERGKFIIELGGKKNVYENFGDFVLKENAFNTTQGQNAQGGYFNNTSKANSLYVDISILDKPASKSSPVEGNYQSVADLIRTADKTAQNDTAELLRRAMFAEDQINFMTGNNQFGINLVPITYDFDAKMTNANAKYRNGKIVFSNAGANESQRNNKTLRRLLIHEQLHAQFDKHKLFARQGLVEDLFDTYEQTVKAIEDIINNGDKTSSIYKQAVEFRNWVNQNAFTLDKYFDKLDGKNPKERTEQEKARIFAEEWLVETLSQPLFMNFMNEVEYKGKEVSVSGIETESKSLWQRIIDLLLKLFGINNGNVKDNSIFAQQYLILSNIEHIDIQTNNAKEEHVVTNGDPGIDVTKVIKPTVTDVQDTINQQDQFNEDNPEAYQSEEKETIVEKQIIQKDTSNADAELEMLSTTTTAEEVIDITDDGDAIAKTLGVTRINNMSNYLNMFAEQDKPLIASMIERNELKFACQ